MSYIPKSVDVRGLLRERQELLERMSVVDGLLRFLQVEEEASSEADGAPVAVPRLTLVRAAEEILREANGKPMHGSDVLKRAKAMGVNVRGKNPKNTLFGTLNRKPDLFRNLGSNMWVLTGTDAPASPKQKRRGRRRKKSDRTRCLEALSSLARPSRVADIRAHLKADNDRDIPAKSARSYLGHASREGEIKALGNGLYAPPGYEDESAPDEGGA